MHFYVIWSIVTRLVLLKLNALLTKPTRMLVCSYKKFKLLILFWDHFQFVLCSLYILLGMAVIAMCFSLMQEKVVQGVRSLGRKIGIVKDDWRKYCVQKRLQGNLCKGSYHFKWTACGLDHVWHLQLSQLQTQWSSRIFPVLSKIFCLGQMLT